MDKPQLLHELGELKKGSFIHPHHILALILEYLKDHDQEILQAILELLSHNNYTQLGR